MRRILEGRSRGFWLWSRQNVSSPTPHHPMVVLEVTRGRDAGAERHFHIHCCLCPDHFLRSVAPGDFSV